MSAFTRVMKDPKGMARLVTNYSRVKELQAKGLEIKEIADIFDQDSSKLESFIEVADGLVAGDISFSLDIACNSKRSFEIIASSLA